MTAIMVVQGREVTAADIELIRAMLAAHPARGRTPLSAELCRRWDWRNARGQLKDMACRTLLLKLERAGLIRLPPRIRPSSNGLRNRRPPATSVEQEPIRGVLRDLRPLSVRVAVKDVYLYPLVADFRRELCLPVPARQTGAPACSETEGRAGRC